MQVCAQLLKKFGGKTYYELNGDDGDDEQGYGMPMIVGLFGLCIKSLLTLTHTSGGGYGDHQEQVHAEGEQVHAEGEQGDGEQGA